MLNIESLTLARYAEVTQDGLLNVMGAGWNNITRHGEDGEVPAKFAVAATVLCVDHGAKEFDIVCTLIDPSGEPAARVTATVVAVWGQDEEAVRRIPLAFEMSGVVTQTGRWRVELSTGDDLRVVTFDALRAD